jgi:hypothetical protein
VLDTNDADPATDDCHRGDIEGALSMHSQAVSRSHVRPGSGRHVACGNERDVVDSKFGRVTDARMRDVKHGGSVEQRVICFVLSERIDRGKARVMTPAFSAFSMTWRGTW